MLSTVQPERHKACLEREKLARTCLMHSLFLEDQLHWRQGSVSTTCCMHCHPHVTLKAPDKGRRCDRSRQGNNKVSDYGVGCTTTEMLMRTIDGQSRSRRQSRCIATREKTKQTLESSAHALELNNRSLSRYP